MVKKIGKYELGRTLGSGTFGKVKYAVDTSDPNKTPYAIKVLDRKQIEKENMQEQLKNEIAIMKMLKHENVVKMYEVIQSPQHIYIVLEIITGGELFDRIVAAKRFDESTARRYFQQLVFGVNYCHTVGGVAHRDLKPENLLLDANDQLKISDFGLSAITQSNGKEKLLMTTCGTPNYVAPEVLKEKGYNGFLTDIWSCGVILFVMLAGYLPFDDRTMNGLFVKIEKGEYRMPRQFSMPVKHLITRMLTVDPTKRITLSEIMDDPWFKQGIDPQELARNKRIAEGKADKPTTDAVAAAMTTTEQDASVVGNPTAVAPATETKNITAFELASRLTMGTLSPLISKDNPVIRRNTQFVADTSVSNSMTKVEEVLTNLKANPSKGKSGKELKGYFTPSKGPIITYTVWFQGTVCPELTLVEVRRGRGDTLEFQAFYRKLVRLLKDICPRQPPAEDAFGEETEGEANN
eukprot:TRINITY_DN68143_c6_g15_i1.p1 TRINITY_DN68143_c6_g15~~TRINITY_DN68143_c6_g15_i1.p1  ORF type:complete len:464 (-),score=59.71 TRINITY_DN68143_c6_g15_i1:404-1795(-)